MIFFTLKKWRCYLIVSFGSVKGGVGKTACCMNIAYSISKKYKVLVVDFDSQGSATHHISAKVGRNLKASIGDVLSGKCSLEKATHHYGQKMYVVPVNYDFYESIDEDRSYT